jgi:hypothetical protein
MNWDDKLCELCKKVGGNFSQSELQEHQPPFPSLTQVDQDFLQLSCVTNSLLSPMYFRVNLSQGSHPEDGTVCSSETLELRLLKHVNPQKVTTLEPQPVCVFSFVCTHMRLHNSVSWACVESAPFKPVLMSKYGCECVVQFWHNQTYNLCLYLTVGVLKSQASS